MAEVLFLPPARNRMVHVSMHRVHDTTTLNDKDTSDVHRQTDRTVIPVDFESKDLQLLRYRARGLEEARYVLYKQSTHTEINTGHECVSISIRVLVQKRMVHYYFYCPWCGTKILGSLFPNARASCNFGATQWREIEQAVQDGVRMKVLDHEYRNHRTGKWTG